MWQPGPEGFAAFFAAAEPKLRRALVAAYGADRGGDAASEALVSPRRGSPAAGDELVYTDESGITLRFVPDDGADPPCR